jgi:sugar phosphate isomerase/epimerase
MQNDILIGTLAPAQHALTYLPRIWHHGFESYSLTFWKQIPDDLTDLKAHGKKVVELLAGSKLEQKPVISSIGVFGNVLTDERTAADFARAIEAAKDFGTDMVTGFAGRVVNKPIPDSMERFKQVWEPMVKRAKDLGVKIAFENCDMGGTWEYGDWNIAHSPKAWEMMFNTLPYDNIGLEWEPCHQMNSLIDPLPQLREWLPKVLHVHGKDATIFWDVVKTKGIRGGTQYVHHRTPGFGDTNWTDVISILRMGKFKGAIDIEGWHDPVYNREREMLGQVHGLNYLKNCRGGAWVPTPKFD